jgi:hypothetical protein
VGDGGVREIAEVIDEIQMDLPMPKPDFGARESRRLPTRDLFGMRSQSMADKWRVGTQGEILVCGSVREKASSDDALKAGEAVTNLELAREIANGGPLTREAVEARAAHVIGAAFANLPHEELYRAASEAYKNGEWRNGEWSICREVYDLLQEACERYEQSEGAAFAVEQLSQQQAKDDDSPR